MLHRRKRLILQFKEEEKLEFGNLVWELQPILRATETESSSQQGTFNYSKDSMALLTVHSNGRGGGDNAGGTPANGTVPISTLQQAVVDFDVDPSSGVLTQKDYFEPHEYDSLNGGDKDFGSSGVSLLDPTVFSGAGVSRIATAAGKSGKLYFMNADNLGGFAGS